jgi:formylmethanofuran dehydrogenase subunit E
MIDIKGLLEKSAARHTHLCPRQVLGARIGLAGASALGLALPRRDKRLLVILETDGCFADGVEVATSCTIGHRTLRIEDYGKIAATFVDVETERTLRIAPQPDLRHRAFAYADGESRHYFAQLQAYQSMPDDELLNIQPVYLNTPIQDIVSRAGIRVNCEICGEEIINEREVILHGRVLCLACGWGGYYSPAPEFVTTGLLHPQVME